jgi:hypothetical protein
MNQLEYTKEKIMPNKRFFHRGYKWMYIFLASINAAWIVVVAFLSLRSGIDSDSIIAFSFFTLGFLYSIVIIKRGGAEFKKDNIYLINIVTFRKIHVSNIEKFDFCDTLSMWPGEKILRMILQDGRQLPLTFLEDPNKMRFEKDSPGSENHKIVKALNEELRVRKEFYDQK